MAMASRVKDSTPGSTRAHVWLKANVGFNTHAGTHPSIDVPRAKDNAFKSGIALLCQHVLLKDT